MIKLIMLFLLAINYKNIHSSHTKPPLAPTKSLSVSLKTFPGIAIAATQEKQTLEIIARYQYEYLAGNIHIPNKFIHQFDLSRSLENTDIIALKMDISLALCDIDTIYDRHELKADAPPFLPDYARFWNYQMPKSRNLAKAQFLITKYLHSAPESMLK